jgi:carbamoyl-phosphate synthase small subunit
VAFDYGIKDNILRRLRQNGFSVTVVPATTADEVLALDPDESFFQMDPAIRQYCVTLTNRCAV